LLHLKSDKKNCDILPLLPHIHFFLSGGDGDGSVVIVVVVVVVVVEAAAVAAINTGPWQKKDSEGKPHPIIKF